jgi:hypothetical protein
MRLRLAVLFGLVGLAAFPTGAVAADLIYEQRDNPGGGYAASDDVSGTEVADDFVIPQGEAWRLDRVNVWGLVACSSCLWYPSVNLRVYSDAGQLPGPLRVSLKRPVSDFSNFDIIVGGSVLGPILPPGHYWLSVQALGAGWSWRTREVQSGAAAALRGPACPNWTVRTLCAPSPAQPDQIFWISGFKEEEAVFRRPFVYRSGAGFIPVTFAVPGTAVVIDQRATSAPKAKDGSSRPRIRQRSVRVVDVPGRGLSRKLPVTPTRRTKRKLQNGQKVKVRVSVTFTPDGGYPYSRAIPLTLKRTAAN